MSQVTYEEVVRLAEKLSRAEQALIEHLQRVSVQRSLRKEERKSLINSVTVTIPPGQEFSDRRSDWYDDDGR